MKKLIVGVAVIVIVGGLIAGYMLMSRERTADAEGDKPVAAESKIGRNAVGEITVTIDDDGQKRIALKMEPLAFAQLQSETKGYGHVLDPATFSAAVAELVSARATADASRKDLARIQSLAQQSNASARSLEATQAAADRDQADVESARAKFSVAWGGALANRDDLSKFAETLASSQNALVRIDLPAGEILKRQPAGARLFALGDENTPVEAEFIGVAPAVESQTQGQGFLFLVSSHNPAFAPGAAVVGYVQTPGEPQNGVLIPQNAVIRFNGEPWIYLQSSNDTFTRREISEKEPLASGWFMQADFKPGDQVVVTGAQMLLSEEQKNQIQIGD